MRAKLALVLHLSGVGECGRLIWVWSVQAQGWMRICTHIRNQGIYRAIFGWEHGVKDAKIGYSLRLTKLFKLSGGRFIGQDGLGFLFRTCHRRKKNFWLGRWWAGG